METYLISDIEQLIGCKYIRILIFNGKPIVFLGNRFSDFIHKRTYPNDTFLHLGIKNSASLEFKKAKHGQPINTILFKNEEIDYYVVLEIDHVISTDINKVYNILKKIIAY